MIQQHHLGTQGRALGCNDGITKTRADVHGMFPKDASTNIIQAPYIFASVSGTLVALFVVELVLFLIVVSLMLAINDKWGKKELGGGWFMLAMMISGALTSAIFLYYIISNWTIP